jgi:hypothetical protein
VLSHLRNQLSVQSTRALLCLGVWSKLGFVEDNDVKSVTSLPDLKDDEEEEELSKDWDTIVL